MKLSRVVVSLCVLLACASLARAQSAGGSQSPASVGENAPPRVLRARANRAAVVKLKSGESVACNFLGADDEKVEVEAAGARRVFILEAVASIVFADEEKRKTEASSSSPPRVAGRASNAPLVVTARLCETYERFTALSGEVRNASPRTINNLVAVGTFRAKNGALVKVEQQLVGDVASGRTTNFKVMWWYDPRIESCTVSFRIFGGKPISHTEALEQ